MPDVLIVGGGIIGAACAQELSRLGASVTLLERAELAAGASGRNQGLFSMPRDPLLAPMARASLTTYLEVLDDSPMDVPFDREPRGRLVVAAVASELDAATREETEVAQSLGIRVERLGGTRVNELEPELAPELTEGWLVEDGRRLDPTAMTLALADLARWRGATVRHHLGARRLLVRGGAVRGVVTDDGPVEADTTVVAAGPWSAGLVRLLGIRVPVTPVRGWLVQFAPDGPLISRIVAGVGESDLPDSIAPITARDLMSGEVLATVGPLLLQAPDGTLIAGSSREPALSSEPEDRTVPAAIVRGAVGLVPALAEAEVLATWWGVRPMTPDERPLVGTVAPGLVLATGHGSWGVILGAGTGALVASIVLGGPPPFDPAPFNPLRFA